jgi:radical SAM protein with 4Fe4S-binding SPASM domain
MINLDNVAKIKNSYSSKDRPEVVFAPAVYVLEPTSRCNLACPICPNPLIAPEKHGDMSVEQGVLAARKISPFAELVMLYFMGEPLMHPQIFNYIRGVRKEIQGKIAISTNAVLLDAQARSSLLHSGVDIVICSIDGYTKRRYEKIRRGAIFEDVISNVENLLAERAGHAPDIVVKCIDVGIPQAELDEFKKHWASLGASAHISWFNTWGGQISSAQSSGLAPFPHVSKARMPCSEPWFKMVINWRGDVVLCCVDWQSNIKLGNIFEMGVEEIWYGAIAKDLRLKHRLEKWNQISSCSKCTQWSDIGELDVYCQPRPENYHVVF